MSVEKSVNVEVTPEVVFNKMERKDLRMIDPRQLVQKENHNVRDEISYTNQSFLDLKRSIKENGFKEEHPISVYREVIDGQETFVVRGHGNRRTRAVQELIAEGHDIARVPVVLVPKGNATEEADLIQMLTSNMGEPLKLHEKGRAFVRLIGKGYTRKEIERQTSCSQSEISNAIQLAGATIFIQNHMSAGRISPNTVLAIFRETDDETKRYDMVMEALKNALQRSEQVEAENQIPAEEPTAEAPKPKRGRPALPKEPAAPKVVKATAKDVAGLSPKTPLQKMEKAIEVLASMQIENDSATLLNALVAILKNGKSTQMDIVNLISPPVVEQLADHLGEVVTETATIQEQGEPQEA